MEILRLPPRTLLILSLITVAAASGDVRAASVEASRLPPGVKLSAQHISADEKNGAIVAEGAVTIEAGFGRIQADRMTFREGHIVEADGNVLMVWEKNRISGSRMSYDMGQKDDPDPEKRIARGVIENAIGQVDPEFYFDALKVETIGDDHVILHTATVTTCTQPVPYWSFRVSTAKIKLEGYAHMFNLRPKIKKMPILYLPYLLWPVKRERAPGLLFPEIGTTSQRGTFLSLPVFVPLGRSADVTFIPEYYTLGGWAGGVKLRWIPNQAGYAEAEGQYIDDRITGMGRYRVQLKQTQGFLNGFRMVSDVDIVSDFNYFTDFVRNLTYASSPTILGRMSFTRSGSWTSVLVQEQYREQLFSDGTTLTQTTFPELEWRGRSRRIGKSPIYFTYVSSLSAIRQNSTRLDADYYRGDLAPTFSAPWSPAPWLDITPTLALRSTYWTQHQEPADPLNPSGPVVVDDSGIWRNLAAAGVEFRGPKFVKIFEGKPQPGKDGEPPGPPLKYKNTIEPSIAYTYQQAFDKSNEIILYDEVDNFGVNANSVTYGLASRLIAQRPRAEAEQPGGAGEKILVPEGESGKLREAPSAVPETPDAPLTAPPKSAEEKKAPAPLEPVEIASVEVTQTYSFNSFPSTADLDGRPTTPAEISHLSAINLAGRYNPSRLLSFNLTGRYDILFNAVSDVSLSGNFREPMVQGLFSVVYRQGLGFDQVCNDPSPDPDPTVCSNPGLAPRKDATQFRFQGNIGPIAGRIRLGIDATYNLTPTAFEKHLPYRRARLEYYTQCCGFLAEYLVSEYSAFPRREFRFAVDLRGIGKLFDFNQANQ